MTDTVARTITYKMSDGSKAPASVKDSLTFTASKEIDKVTGEVRSTKWSKNQDFNDVESPVVKGYTPDKTVVSNKNVAHDAKDIDVVVTYNADAQKATVAYIDDTTGETLKTTPLSGKTNAKSGYTTAQDIQAYKDLGYVLVSDDTNGAEIVFDNDDKNDQKFAVHLKHDTVTVDPKNPGKPGEPINPGKGSAVYPDGTDKAVKKDVPAPTPKAQAEKLVKTHVKAPKAVKEAAPAEKLVKTHVKAPKAVKKDVPAPTPKAQAEKLVKTHVKAPKAVKEAAPAEMPAQKAAQAQDQLPQTGEDNSKAAFGLGLASILGGIGILGAFKRKKKEN